MEIKNNQIHLSASEELATGYKSPVSVENFCHVEIAGKHKRRSDIIDDYESILAIPDGRDLGSIGLSRDILDRHRNTAREIINAVMEHKGIAIPEEIYHGSPEIELRGPNN